MPDNVYRFQGRIQAGYTGAWIYDRIAECIEPRPLSAERSQQLRVRILSRLEGRRRATFTVRAADGEWRPLAPGVTLKLLRHDTAAQRMTAYIRMEPGASLEPHDHAQTEECLILEGEIFIGRHRLGRGDAHVARAGTSHDCITSPRGALMLVHAQFPSSDPRSP
jgi:anti-sigma factor ChrR (cupin superfamily)